MTPDNSGMPPLPEELFDSRAPIWRAILSWRDEVIHGDDAMNKVSVLEDTIIAEMHAYGRQVAQMCAELCERFAERQMSPAECAAAIKHGFGLEKP
jgi:hypothetical protein